MKKILGFVIISNEYYDNIDELMRFSLMIAIVISLGLVLSYSPKLFTILFGPIILWRMLPGIIGIILKKQ